MLRFIQEVNTTTRSCALWDLEEETDYIVHVQSISMSGTSPLSEPLRFRTPKEAETQASKSKGKMAQRDNTLMEIPHPTYPTHKTCTLSYSGSVLFKTVSAERTWPFDNIVTDFCLKTQ